MHYYSMPVVIGKLYYQKSPMSAMLRTHNRFPFVCLLFFS